MAAGLVSYKKFWRGFLRRPRTGNARRLTGDLHRLGGLWSLWFVALIGLTGLWYLVESLGGEAPFSRTPVLQAAQPVALDGTRIDELVARARRAYPGLRISALRLPLEANQPLGIFGQADAVLVRERANAVWIDPRDGRIVEVLKGEDLSVHQRISEMADPLHFGTFGGMTTKIIWFVFGAAMSALAVTGVVICSLRLKNEPPPRGQARAARGSNALARAWFSMGAWAYPSTGLVLLSLAMLPGWLMR